MYYQIRFVKTFKTKQKITNESEKTGEFYSSFGLIDKWVCLHYYFENLIAL